jgi:hypothetical protein
MFVQDKRIILLTRFPTRPFRNRVSNHAGLSFLLSEQGEVLVSFNDTIPTAGHSSRAVYGMNCLRSLGRGDGGFESHARYGCLLCVCVRLFCVCIVMCVGSGLATGSSPLQGFLPSVKNLISSFLPLGATDQVELWPPEQYASILLYSSSSLPIISLSLYGDHHVHLVSEQFSFYGVRLLASRPTPNLEDQGIPLRLPPTS